MRKTMLIMTILIHYDLFQLDQTINRIEYSIHDETNEPADGLNIAMALGFRAGSAVAPVPNQGV